jgi:hypothetical protein
VELEPGQGEAVAVLHRVPLTDRHF